MDPEDHALAVLSARYERFAEEEARGRSSSYEAFARGVAADTDVLGFLAALPEAKQQPNLLLAAVRHLFGVQTGWKHFRHSVLTNQDAVRSVMLARATQTNEPGRCAVLLPILARLPQPLAIIEVGASAGLCLLPDRYGYDYGSSTLMPERSGEDPPVFGCIANPATPLPQSLPHIVWRAGLDLSPIDAAEPEQAAWLETLVWPEQRVRLARLQAALRIASAHPPRIVKGDLLGDALPRLCQEAPEDATLVVFHTAVMVYVAELAARQAFAARMPSLCPYWLSTRPPASFLTSTRVPGCPKSPGVS